MRPPGRKGSSSVSTMAWIRSRMVSTTLGVKDWCASSSPSWCTISRPWARSSFDAASSLDLMWPDPAAE
jgi:hypothetical protein